MKIVLAFINIRHILPSITNFMYFIFMLQYFKVPNF